MTPSSRHRGAVGAAIALLLAVPPWAAPGAGSSVPAGGGGPTDSSPVTTRAGGTACRAAGYRLEPLAAAERQAGALVRRMSLAQELDLMDGVGPYPPPAHTVGATAAIPSLGVPALTEQDGPAGVGDGAGGVTQLPAPEALAATFDPAAAACYGQVIGAEARRKGVDLVYGPTVNIVRVPQWGRTFESLGEDPVLTGEIGTAEVEGLQRTGTMAQVKHYAVYNQETYRMTSADDAVVDAKALHEIYLRAWDQIAAAGPASVMCSYSTINGSAACENRSLIRDHLDGEIGFAGFVGSDYYAPGSTVGSAEAGLDQEQPVPLHYGPSLAAAVEDGRVPRSTVDEAARRVLTELFRFGMVGRRPTGSITALAATSGDAAVAQSVAEEGTVLLRNRDATLPLDPRQAGRLAVVGPAADDPVTTGGGSAVVSATATVSPLAGIRAAVGRDQVTSAPGLPEPGEFTPIPAAYLGAATTDGVATPSLRLTAPETGTYDIAVENPTSFVPETLSLDGRPIVVDPGTPPRSTYVAAVDLVAGQTYTLSGAVSRLSWVTPDRVEADMSAAVAAARSASTVVVVVGDGQESEGADRPDLGLPAGQDRLVEEVAAANPRTIVVVDAGGPVLMPWLDHVAAVLDAWYPGERDGSALADVLFGRVDPSGHLPLTFPRSVEADPLPSSTQFPGLGGEVDYREGVDVGYRWYDATGTTPLFPFGFGLSYTRFRFGEPSVSTFSGAGGPEVTVRLPVSDVGRRPGADVVQLYLGEPAASGEPPRQLEAFRRVALRPGQSVPVSFTLRGRQLAAYDTAVGKWRIARGRYQVYVGDSSSLAELPARSSFTLARSATVPDRS